MEAFLDFISGNENLWGFLALMLGAGVEYVFPPFPGDTVVLLAGILVAARGWSVLFVMTSVTLGSVLGAMLDYAAGRWIAERPDSRIARWLNTPSRAPRVEKAIASMQRYGPVFLTINRFLPGIRAFFFVGAGMARLNPWRVAFWGGVSALLWNVLILTAGWLLGGNLEALRALFERYTIVMWSLILGAVAVWGARQWWSARQERREASTRSPQPIDASEPTSSSDVVFASPTAARTTDEDTEAADVVRQDSKR